ncbi:MucR family transcriptional regulator [Methylobacterium sp. NMS14P]|uniref:MucR family transcriptional regulator n=1 Tax=Methylobacterium sp. NMS14P TaxID=2894310 RepID=UPI002358E644|nr:MucR family transcriptional regulator [Methylobacterium sp. NMS14P]WCS27812.1 MucR family transcriptional regulator [Methylobacterium sp. NMS14P]
MAETYDLTPGIDTAIDYTVNIVANYVRLNHVPAAELPGLIRSVHATLAGLSGAAPVEAAAESLTPAQIRKSITPDALISFIDGKPYKTLKRHLTKHGLDARSYREQFGLPADYPMVCASYSAARATLAKQMGLGVPGAQAKQKPLAAVA